MPRFIRAGTFLRQPRTFLAIVFVFFTTSPGLAQTTPKLEVFPLENPSEIQGYIRDILFSGGGEISNIAYYGSYDGVGRFDKGNDIGFFDGIILSNGWVKNAEGFNPNGAQYEERDELGPFKDSDLEKLLGLISGENKPVEMTDASVITFYFKPYFDNFSLTYVFASEEYKHYQGEFKPDFVAIDSSKVDLMAIFYWSNPADKKVGTVFQTGPGVWNPVTIKSINDASHTEYYIQNPEHPFEQPYSTHFDAFTVPMLLKAENVVPCINYGFKIAVADYSYMGEYNGQPFTNHFNTGVFLKAGSFYSGSGLEWAFDLQSDNNEFDAHELVEGGCSRMIINFTKNKRTMDTLWVRFKIAGASPGEYTITPSPFQDSLLWIPPDTNQAIYILEAVDDGLPEDSGNGTERWLFRYQEDPCDIPLGGIGTGSAGYSGIDTLSVHDYNPFVSNSKNYGPSPSTIYYCGNAVTLSASDIIEGGIPPYQYSWIQQSTGQGGLAETFPIIISGSPDHSICYVKDRCTDFAYYQQGTYDVYVYSTLTAAASPNFQLCENLDWPITITSTNVGDDFSVQWFFQGNLVGSNKTYTVTWDEYYPYYGISDSLVFNYIVTDECGNTNNGSVIAFWDPVVEISGPPVICLGEPVTLQCTDGQSYQWYNNSVAPGNEIPGATTQFYTFTPASPGSYTICVSILNACDQVATSCYNFEVSQLICDILLDGSDDLNACPDTPFSLEELNGYSEWHWSWYDDGQNHFAQGQVISISLLDPGNHTITVSAYNEHGCYDERDFTINVFPYTQASATAEFNPVCEDYPTTLNAQSVVSGSSYFWSADPPDPTLTGQENLRSPVVSPKQATVYTCLVTDNNGCSQEAVIRVEIRDPIEGFVQSSLNFVCTDDQVEMSFTGTVLPTNATYFWTFEGGTPSTSSNDTELVTWDTPGDKNVTVHIIEPGCEGTFSSLIKVYPKPSPLFTASNNTGCQPVTVQFHDQSDNTYDPKYHWDFGDGSTSSLANPEHTYDSAGTFNVSLTVINSTGCDSSVTVHGIVEVYPATDAVFEADPPAATTNHPHITFIPGMSGPDNNHTWDFGDGTFSNDVNPTHTYLDAGSFTVIHTLVNEYGCIDIDTIEVGILTQIRIFIPNAFTPDGDGLNDCLGISGTVSDLLNRFQIFIYDRWGKSVFESEVSDYRCLWDGTLADGSPAESGEYNYLLKGTDLNGKKHVFKGLVMVLK